MGKEGRKVVCEDAEEDWTDEGTLRDAVGQWEGNLRTTSHHLPTATKVAPEPSGVNSIPLELREEDAMVDTVKGATEVDGGDCCHMPSINASHDPFDSIDQGVLRRMTLPVSVLRRSQNMRRAQVG